MIIEILSLIPPIFENVFDESILGAARKSGLIDIRIHNFRDYGDGRHKTVDDSPFGGGPGMVIKIEPIARAIDSILKVKSQKSKVKSKVKIILFFATGKQFDAKMAREWAKKYDRIIMIAGHYEGVDERIFKVLQTTNYKLQAISIGPYVLTGGELPALVVVDAVSRHIPGFLGKAESLEEKRYGIGLPVYTRPETFIHKGKKYKVPKILLSGDHKKIDAWRNKKRDD